jgi:hypothetical protein
MKKLLAIAVLGFFLSGCASMQGNISQGMSKLNYCNAMNLTSFSTACNTKGSFYYQNNIEVLKKGNKYAIFKNVTIPNQSNFFTFNPGNGVFVGEAIGWVNAQSVISSIDKNYNRTLAKSNMQRLEPYIIQCETLGFKRSSEKNASCALDIYKTEMQIQSAYAQAKASQNQANAIDISNNLMLLNQSLKMLNPPVQSRKRFNCTYNKILKVGNITCY